MFFRYNYPALLWAILILALTLTPAPAFPKATWITIYNVDKLIHAVLFGVLYFLMMRGLMKQYSNEFYTQLTIWCILAAALYGGAIEIMQSILPAGRSGEWMDWFADCVGTLLAFMAVRFRWKMNKNSA